MQCNAMHVVLDVVIMDFVSRYTYSNEYVPIYVRTRNKKGEKMSDSNQEPNVPTFLFYVRDEGKGRRAKGEGEVST